MSNYPEWTDLRYFLELARTGRLSEAAQRLEVEHTTVSRRLDRLEQQLGAALFDRSRRGYALTDSGQALMPHAEAMESALLMAMAETGLAVGGVAGKVRIGCPEVFGACVLAPRIHQLYESNPDLEIELMAQQQFPSIAAREVDILVTLNRPRSGRYIVTRLADLHYNLYGSRKYLERHKPINELKDLEGHHFVDYVQDRLMSEDLRHLGKVIDNPNRIFTATSFFSQREAVASGLGLGLMTPYVAGREELVRVLPGKAQTILTLWLEAPTDLYRIRRIRVAWDFIRSIAENEPELFVFPD